MLEPLLILSLRGVAADLAVKVAIATAMATIVFTSISSLRAHHQRGAVRWELVRVCMAEAPCSSIIPALPFVNRLLAQKSSRHAGVVPENPMPRQAGPLA